MERYASVILGGVLVLLVLAVLIVERTLNLNRRRRLEGALRESETGRKKAEAEAQHWQRALAHVSRVSMLGELVGSLAHELSQPLSAILSSAEAARAFLNGPARNEKELRESLDDIDQQGRLAGEIVAGVRAMLKKEAGRMAAQNLNFLIRDVVKMVRAQLLERQVTPVLRLDPLLPEVKGDGVQLRQVLLNLVMNACDAMSDVPSNRRQLTIQSRQLAQEVEVSVIDCGPGFAKGMLQQPFEPFRTTKANGLGLGLAMCRSIIVAHEGRLVAANNNEQGAMLRFSLPLHNAKGL